MYTSMKLSLTRESLCSQSIYLRKCRVADVMGGVLPTPSHNCLLEQYGWCLVGKCCGATYAYLSHSLGLIKTASLYCLKRFLMCWFHFLYLFSYTSGINNSFKSKICDIIRSQLCIINSWFSVKYNYNCTYLFMVLCKKFYCVSHKSQV